MPEIAAASDGADAGERHEHQSSDTVFTGHMLATPSGSVQGASMHRCCHVGCRALPCAPHRRRHMYRKCAHIAFGKIRIRSAGHSHFQLLRCDHIQHYSTEGDAERTGIAAEGRLIIIIWLLHNLVEASFDLFRYLLLGDQLRPWELHPLVS